MKHISLLFIFFIHFTLFSQNRIHGYIKSINTKDPIPYAHVIVENSQLGIICDNQGAFELIIPDSLIDNLLIIKSIGFKDFSSRINSLLNQNQTFFLSEETETLQLFTISAKRKKKMKQRIIGSKKKKSSGAYYLNDGFQVALFFDNKKHHKGLISQARFYINKTGIPSTPFRVRVYGVNKKTGAPNNHLLKKDLIASGIKGNEWVIIDLVDYNIKLPKTGFFIAMEWLPVSKENEYTLKNYKSTHGGQVLGGTHEFGKTSLTWSKKFLTPWVNMSIHPDSKKALNAKISAEILINK